MVALDPFKISPLFNGLDEAILNEIASFAQEEVFHAGQRIYEENAPADRLYILEAGTVTLDISTEQEPRVLVSTVTGEGGVFGWSSLIEPRRYNTSANCLQETHVVSVEAEALLGLLDRNQSVGYVIAQRLAELISSQLRDALDQVKNMLSAAFPGPGQPA